MRTILFKKLKYENINWRTKKKKVLNIELLVRKKKVKKKKKKRKRKKGNIIYKYVLGTKSMLLTHQPSHVV